MGDGCECVLGGGVGKRWDGVIIWMDTHVAFRLGFRN